MLKKRFTRLLKRLNEKYPKQSPHYFEIFSDGSGILCTRDRKILAAFNDNESLETKLLKIEKCLN